MRCLLAGEPNRLTRSVSLRRLLPEVREENVQRDLSFDSDRSPSDRGCGRRALPSASALLVILRQRWRGFFTRWANYPAPGRCDKRLPDMVALASSLLRFRARDNFALFWFHYDMAATMDCWSRVHPTAHGDQV